MKKHLYEIKRLDIPSYLKWWFIQYKFGGTLSEVMENLTSPITLTDSLKRKFKIFEVGGNSEQESYSGKNKFKNNDIESITTNGITMSFKNGRLTLNGTSTAQTNFIGLGEFDYDNTKKYMLNNILISGSCENYGGGIYFGRSSSSTSAIGNGRTFLNSNTSVAYSSEESQKLYAYISIASGKTYNNYIVDFQITEGETADYDYEKYVGGQAAPNQEYNFPIRNVGDNVNIYHIEDKEAFTINGIEWSVNNNIIHATGTATTDSSTRARIPFDMTGKVGTFSFAAKEGAYVYCRVEKNGSTTYPTSPITLDGTETLVQIYPQIARGVTVDTDISIKVEEGPTPTGYSPYNCGSVDVKVENKNLYNDELEIGMINSQGENAYNAGMCRNKGYISLQPNTEYTISLSISATVGLRFYDKDKKYIINMAAVVAPRTFTTPENAYYLRIVIVSTDLTNKVQIEKGSTVTNYIVHEEQTVTFPLQEGQVLHLGDTLEDDGVHQRRFTKVFDGSETFEQFQAWGNYYRARLLMLNAKTFSTNDDNGQLCSHFIYSKSGTLGTEAQSNKGSFAQFHDSDKFYFVFEQTSITAFKAFLAEQYANGTPVTLEYELAEEIIVPYTETQQEAYAKIKKLYSYEGTTYISSDNTPSLIFKIQYVKEE